MPELPEVETIVRGLNRFIPGKTIRAVEIRHKKIAARHGTAGFKRLLEGQSIEGVERVGKYLRFHFRSGDSLVVHLRMTGKFVFQPGGAVPDHPHIRLVLHLAGGAALVYSDLRIFGSFRFHRAGEPLSEFDGVGRDPVKEKIDAAWFVDRCRRRSIPVKVLLLDQKVVCGIGNIYACEALFRAGLSPLLPARRMDPDRARRLLDEIRSLLLLAIRHNGTSVSDFRGVDDKSGGFQRLLRVYGREGEPCPACGRPIRRVRQSQRSTFYCPHCQAR